MSLDLDDDHLPPPVAAATSIPGKPRSNGAAALSPSPWADRGLFLAVGLLAGFAAAYLYLDRNAAGDPQADAGDPHAGLPGVGPGASRDLPGSGGGQPSLASDPAARQKLAALETAVTKDPRNLALLVQLGNAAYDMEDWKAAIDAYERALAIKGGDPGVLTDLGVSYRNVGDPDAALSKFTEAVARDPSHWPARFNMAIVYGVDKGDTKKALEILGKLRKEHPEIPALDRLTSDLEARAKGRAGS